MYFKHKKIYDFSFTEKREIMEHFDFNKILKSDCKTFKDFSRKVGHCDFYCVYSDHIFIAVVYIESDKRGNCVFHYESLNEKLVKGKVFRKVVQSILKNILDKSKLVHYNSIYGYPDTERRLRVGLIFGFKESLDFNNDKCIIFTKEDIMGQPKYEEPTIPEAPAPPPEPDPAPMKQDTVENSKQEVLTRKKYSQGRDKTLLSQTGTTGNKKKTLLGN